MVRIKRGVVVLSAVVVLAACGSTDGQSRRAAATTGDPAAPAGSGCGGGGRPSSGAPPVLGIHHVPTLTRERYEAVVRRLTTGRDRLRSVADGGVEGLLVHVAGEGDDGFWVIDVWASQEAADRFSQRVRPIAQAVGIQQPMKTYRIHTFLTC
jgi:hypothetical protein